MKKIRSRFLWAIIYFLHLCGVTHLNAQTQSPVSKTVSSNGFVLKKQVSNTQIASGVVFTYTIFYTLPAGATNVKITDNVPSTLIIDGVVPGTGCGTPTVTISGNVVTYSIPSVSTGCSGTFQINVHYPAGTTCPGTVARNQVCMEATQLPKICTDFVVTNATAVNPFVVSKGVTGLSWNPQNGCQFIMALDGTVTYTLSVHKSNPYQGNDDGQINLNSAVVTDVLPANAVFVSSPGCAVYNSSTHSITWNLNTLNATTPSVWQSCQITVKYPAGFFPIGTQIFNTATLSGTNACNQPFSTTSNTTCVEVVAPVDLGVLSKSVYLFNKVPGCKGIYNINFCNRGNTPLSFSIQDVIPAGITVNSINFYAASPVTATATLANTPFTAPIASNQSGSINWNAPSNNPIVSLNFSQTGLPAGNCLTIQVHFTINANVGPNTTINNCATMTSGQIATQTSCASFVTTTPVPDLCLFKSICNPQTGYKPGDVFRYRLRVQNIGSQNANNFNFSDILDPSLLYVGGQVAYSSSNYNPACGGIGSTPWTIAAPSVNNATNTLTWNNLSIPAECQGFYYTNCGMYGTQGVKFYFIEFDVQVRPDAASGLIPNTFTASGGNLSTNETANIVYTVINVTHGFKLSKEISKDKITWLSNTSTIAGGNLWYRLGLTNTDVGAIYDVRKVDLLAMNDGVNDWQVLNRALPRGSQFGVSNPTAYTYNAMSASLPPVSGISANTTPGTNLNLQNSLGVTIGTGTNPPTWVWPSVPGNNVGIGYGANYGLVANGILQAIFQVTTAPNAVPNKKVCNDFAAGGAGKYILNGNLAYTLLTPAASNIVCATVDSSECCKKLGLQADPGKCCLKLSASCPVNQIQVNVQGGVMSSATWNCTASLGNYQGQSNYTFNPAGCSTNLQICFNAAPGNTTGWLPVLITITFANGEICRRELRVEACKPQNLEPNSCCGQWALSITGTGLKKTGNFKYLNPAPPKKAICSISMIAPSGMTNGKYKLDGGSWTTFPGTFPAFLNFAPTFTSIEFYMTAPITYSANIILQVNYCDGTYCRDTVRWGGYIDHYDVIIKNGIVRNKLYAVQLYADPNSERYEEITAMAVSLEQNSSPTNERAPKGAYIFAATAGKVNGENLHPQQNCVVSTAMGAYYVFAQFPNTADAAFCGDAIEKGLSLVIADNSGAATAPPLLITYFDAEGNVLSTRKFSNYQSGEVTIKAVEVKNSETDFVQLSVFPNPAKEQATLTYALGRSRELAIDLYDMQGKLVQNLAKGQQFEGFHTLDVNTSTLPAGIYLIRLLSDGLVQTQRLSVVK